MPETNIREALRQTLKEALQQDERVIIMGEDIGAYGGSYGVTRGLLQEFGDERVRDTPISESAVVGCGIGAAMGGLRPIVELMTINFSFLAFDQIINIAGPVHYMSGGQMNVPLIIRMASGGGSRARGDPLARPRRLVRARSRTESRHAFDALRRARPPEDRVTR